MSTRNEFRTVAVLGAGSTGQATAGYLAMSGRRVRLWNRAAPEARRLLDPIAQRGAVTLRGAVDGVAPLDQTGTDLESAVAGADLIIVATTANAHRPLGQHLAKVVDPAQPILIVSGGTFGAFDLWRGLVDGGRTEDLLVAETSTTPMGSQAAGDGVVQVSGEKRRVEIASLPGGRADAFVQGLPEIPLVAAPDVLETGLGNVGPSLHLVPMVLNAGWIEARGGTFRYYRDAITQRIADVADRVDVERLAIATALGKHLTPLGDYLVSGVGAPAGTLYQSINGCEMYGAVMAPDRLNHRFLWEDTVAGALPMVTLGQLTGVPTPTLSALVTLAGALLGRDFREDGRTAANLGLEGADVESIRNLVSDSASFDHWRNKLATRTAAT